MISTPFILAAIAAFIAWKWEAPREAKLIAERIQHDIEEDLEHGELLARRFFLIGGIAFVCWWVSGINQPWQDSWLPLLVMLVCMSGIAWSSFTISHRATLNKLRGMDWRYVSPGNDYDWWWMTHIPKGWKQSQRRIVVKHFKDLLDDDCFRKFLFRSGLAAFAFELFILAASLGGATWILN